MKKLLIFILIAGMAPLAGAQYLSRHIPATAVYVVALDLQRIGGRSIQQEIRSLDEVRHAGFQTKGIELISQITANPQDYGINASEKAFVFMHIGDTVESICILLSISNKEVFQREVGQIVRQNNPNAGFTSEGGIEILTVRSEGVAMNNDMAIIAFGKGRDYYYSSVMPNGYYVEKQKIIRMLQTDPESVTVEMLEKEVEEEDLEESYEEYDSYEMEVVAPIEQEETDYEEVEPEYIEDDIEMEESIDVYDMVPTESVAESVEPEKPYDHNHPIFKALDEKWEKIKQEEERKFYLKQENKTRNQLIHYFNLPQDQSVYDLSSFREGIAEPADMAIWVSGKALTPLMGSTNYKYRMAVNSAMAENKSELEKLLLSNFTITYLDLVDDKVAIRSVQYMDSELDQYVPVVMEPLNKKLYKYVPSDPLVYLSLNIDPEKFFNMQIHFWKLYLDAMKSENYSGQSLGALEMVDLFLDKDVLFHTLTGEGIFMVNSVRTEISEGFRYEYDQESYESKRVPSMDTNYIPSFVWLMPLENVDNMRRLLTIYEHFEMLEKAGEDYWVPKNKYSHRQKDFVCFAIRDGILVITSDSTYDMNVLANGLPKSEQASGKMLNELIALQNGIFINRDGQYIPVRRYTSRSVDQMLSGVNDGTYAIQKVEPGKITSGGTFSLGEMSNATLSEFLQSLLSIAN